MFGRKGRLVNTIATGRDVRSGFRRQCGAANHTGSNCLRDSEIEYGQRTNRDRK